MHNPEEQQPYRTSYLNVLANLFIKDMDKAIAEMPSVQALEVVEHLTSTVESLQRYAQAKDEEEQGAIGDEYTKAENAFLKRWGKLLAPYRERQFHSYFNLETLLVEKDIVSIEEFHKLEDQEVSAREVAQMVYMVRRVLISTKERLMEQLPPSAEATELLAKSSHFNKPEASDLKDKSPQVQSSDESDDEEQDGAIRLMTKSRSRLALYYLLKAMGVDPRSDSAVADITRLSHLVSGERFTTLANSNAYKFFLKLPDYKSAKGKLSDLQFIRPYFEGVGLSKVVALIDAEIEKAKALL